MTTYIVKASGSEIGQIESDGDLNFEQIARRREKIAKNLKIEVSKVDISRLQDIQKEGKKGD